jgi:hypothetical protein
MQSHRPRNVSDFLATGIQSLMPQAEYLLRLRRILADTLPANLRQSCTIANYMQGKVVIFVENSAVAAKLKLMLPELQGVFVKRGVEVTGIGIRVQPKEPEQRREKHAKLTDEAIRSLQGLADQLPDSKLKNTVAGMAARNRSER